ncbi:MAG TPA: nuclear transport factor 2 family protein [Bryobacteraceae bacterium]|jgi:ketosteroid isomerase-like protein|nr:nuclear transport factor 2 family protein [Bryobacteraceae bacterium]
MPNNNQQSSKDQSQLHTLFESIRKAHHDKKAAGIVAAYAPDARIFDLAPPLSHRGMDQSQLQAWLDGWETPVDIEPRDFEYVIDGDLAFGHGFLQMSGKKPGGPPVKFWMRATVALQRRNGEWRIIHDHTSVPFYMDGSLRGAFDLNP